MMKFIMILLTLLTLTTVCLSTPESFGESLSTVCDDLPYKLVDEVKKCYKPNCQVPIKKCPDHDYDMLLINDLRCPSSENPKCELEYSKKSFYTDGENFDEVKVTLKDMLFCLSEYEGDAKAINLFTGEAGYCVKKFEFSPKISDGQFFMLNRSKVCCGPFCDVFSSKDPVPYIFQFCVRLEYHDLLDHSIHGVIINNNFKTCEDINCFFCSEVIFRFQCNETWLWMFWAFSWLFSISFLVAVLYMKWKIFTVLNKYRKDRKLRAYKMQLVKESRNNNENENDQDDDDKDEFSIMIPEYQRLATAPSGSTSSLTKAALISVMLSGAQACIGTFDLSVTGDNHVLGQSVLSLRMGETACYNMNWKETLDMGTVQLVSFYFVPDMEYLYDTSVSPWEITSWDDKSEIRKAFKSDGKVCYKVCKKLVIDTTCRQMCNKNGIGQLYHVKKWQPRFLLKVSRPGANLTEMIAVRAGEVKIQNEIVVKELSVEMLNDDLPRHYLRQMGEFYLLPSHYVSAVGIPEAGKVGSWQSYNDKDVKVSNEIAPKLDPENCYHWAGPFRTTYSDCNTIHQDPNINKYKLPMEIDDGEFTEDKNVVEFHPNQNSLVSFQIQVPFIGHKVYNEFECNVVELRVSGVIKQSSGSLLSILVDSDVPDLKVHFSGWQMCKIKNRRCTMISTVEVKPSSLEWECGKRSGQSKVIGELGKAPSLRELGDSFTMDDFSGERSFSGFIKSVESLHCDFGFFGLSMTHTVIGIVVVLVIIKVL